MRDVTKQPTAWQASCPISSSNAEPCITLAHGEGGRLMRRLIREHVLAILASDRAGSPLISMNDAALLPPIDGPIAITTDSFVVSPLFFPGGDIGSLAVFGTVNDLAVSGAKPLYLTLSLILEEGTPLALFDRILHSVARAAARAGVQVVAGDTKVVPRGATDGVFINTTGVGRQIDPVPLGPEKLQPGDELIVTGPIGRHGIAILCAREELDFSPPPESDCAPLLAAATRLRERLGPQLRAMRDATRGGVAAVLHEWAEASLLTLTIQERDLPVTPTVRGACELLGLDPVHIANEGTMLIAVAPGSVNEALNALRSLPETKQAAHIGTVTKRAFSPVTVLRTIGSAQPLDDPLGTPLPRIC